MRDVNIGFRRAGAALIFPALATLALWSASKPALADLENREEARIRRGFQIAPVPLRLAGKDPNLVGLGSYIVNAQASCNDCHAPSPAAQYVPGGNPFFGQHPEKTNPATYLAGGRSFGVLVPNAPEIVSRNLTPNGKGQTLGGDSFETFLATMRTGADPDKAHPTCVAGSSGPCFPPPFDGALLQVMPWPVFQHMTTHELRAVYEYLGAIPCVEGGPGQPAGRCNAQ